MKDLMPDIIT